MSMAQGALSYVFIKYATSAVALPWEVGKTLLQVQWVPRDYGAVQDQEEAEGEAAEDQTEDDGVCNVLLPLALSLIANVLLTLA